MKKNKFLIAGVAIAALLAFIFIGGDDENTDVEAVVEKGLFKVAITTSGELKAKSSTKIAGPSSGMRRLGLYNTKISELVAEGTKVDSGDFVAALDRSDLLSKLKDVDLEVQKMESQFIQTKLDTTLDLRSARNELINLAFSLEESEIKLEQSKYEPPATIRKAEIELEQAKRRLSQEKRNFEIKKQQAAAKMQEVNANLAQKAGKKELMLGVLDQFNIRAPSSGIIIYMRSWDGSKVTTGSTISPWNSNVAELPNLTRMTSRTFVNEVDIRKVKKDQRVVIGVDAFPDKELEGIVIEVANVGEQLPNSEAKVFQVTVELQDPDTTLLPGMSTSNNIIANELEDILSVPLECIHSVDSTTYVYKKTNFSVVKQEVVLGISNENSTEITKGLTEGDVVLLSIPENKEELSIELLN